MIGLGFYLSFLCCLKTAYGLVFYLSFLCCLKTEYGCAYVVLLSGTSANQEHFQVYPLEGISRWNQDRVGAAIAGGNTDPPTYSELLWESSDQLSLSVLGKKLHPPTSRRPENTQVINKCKYGFICEAKKCSSLQILKKHTFILD